MIKIPDDVTCIIGDFLSLDMPIRKQTGSYSGHSASKKPYGDSRLQGLLSSPCAFYCRPTPSGAPARFRIGMQIQVTICNYNSIGFNYILIKCICQTIASVTYSGNLSILSSCFVGPSLCLGT